MPTGSLSAAEDDFLLYWQVNDPMVTLVGGSSSSLQDFIANSAHSSEDWGVQVSVSGENGFVEYLNLWYNGGEGGWRPAVTGAELDNFRAGPTYANIGSYVFKGTDNEYASDSYVFALEIGYYDAANNYNFVSQVKSESWDYNNFMSNAPEDPDNPGHKLSYIQSAELQIPNIVPWSGGSYAAPEPSTGLLLAIGLSFLSLRRRRQGKEAGAA